MKSVVDLWGQVLVLLAVVITSYSPAAFTMKRAVPVYRLSTHVQGNNSVEKDKDEFFNKFWKQQNGGSCPFGQMVQRNRTVCCFVTVCGPGEEIEECRTNGTADKCSKCKPGFIQMNNISSLDMKEASCFLQVKDHEDCPMGDMKPARNNLSDNFPLPCECKFEECYIEDEVGSCNKMAKCKPGFQMNRKSGNCDPCPWYAYKNVSGCQPCTKNVTLLRQGKPGGLFIPPSMTTTTAKDNTEYSPENESSVMRENTQTKTEKSPSLNIVYVGLLVIIAVPLIVLAIMKVYSDCRKRMSRPSGYVHPTTSTEPLLQNPTYNAHTGGEYGNGVLNCSMNGGHRADVENGGIIPVNRVMLDGNTRRNMPHGGMNGGAGVENGDLIHANQGMLGGNNGRTMPHGGGATQCNSTTVKIDNIPAKARTQPTGNIDLPDRDVTFEASRIDHDVIGGVENVACSGGRLMANSEGHHVIEGETNNVTDAVSRTNAVNLLECEATESPEESCANAKHTLEVEAKKSGEKKTNNAKPSTLSIHGNQFQDCMIFIGEKTRRKNCTGKTNKKEVHVDNLLKNISGSFEMSESMTNSFGIGSSPTLKQSDRRDLDADTENVAAGRGKVNNEPPCRPELTEGACGTGMDSTAAPRREVKFNSKDLKIEMECSGSVTEQELDGRDDGRKLTGEMRQAENADIRGSPETRGVDPFQRSTNRERPVRRVQPLRQNSECVEVRHVSGYPSEGHDDESSELVVSYNSMSYAIMHLNSEFSNGYMTADIANNGDIDDVGSDVVEHGHLDHAQRNSPIGRELDTGGSEQMYSGLDGAGEVCNQLHSRDTWDGGCTDLKTTVNLDRQRCGLPQFRRDVNRAGVTHAVPPGIREAPEGNSISYSGSGNENDHFISRPDMQQTHRKVVADEEAEEDSTREKEVNSGSTTATIVDDDDLTRYKTKEIEECENPICMKSGNNANEELESTEDSFEINSEEMQNMNNVQGIAEDEKAKNIETEHAKEGVDLENSFEVDSRDIEDIREHKTNSDDSESVTETSFDVDMKDIVELKRVTSCSSLGSANESEASFEIASNDIDGIKAAEDTSFEVDGKDNALLKNDVATTVMEESLEIENTSFELNSDQIENLAINQSADTQEHENVDTMNAEDVRSEVEIDSNESQAEPGV